MAKPISFARSGVAAVFAVAVVGFVACGPGLTGCLARSQPKVLPPAAVRPQTRIKRKNQDTQEIGWLTIRLENPPPDSLIDVKPEDLPAHIKSLYRLHPDRRFLYAVAELERLTTAGARSGVMAIRFEDGRWRLTLDGAPIGDLPEFPSFADAKSFVASRLRAHPAFKRTSADPLRAADRVALENGLASDVFPVLARLNAAWVASPGDPALAEAALHGLLWLGLQTHDELELSDPILGKALALLVIAEAREPSRLDREECLLASLLGYEDHAKLVALRLPVDDPVRLFAEWDLTRLKTLAHAPQAEPRSEYLYLLRLAEGRTKEEAWFHEFEASSWSRRLDGPSLRLVLTLDPFDWRTAPAALMESRVMEDLPTASRVASSSASVNGGASWRVIAMGWLEDLRASGQKPPESRLPEFEQAVDSEASKLDGPLLDRQVIRAFRLANFYSSVYTAARYYFDRLSTTDGAETFGNSLASPPAGSAAELKDWILHRVRVRRSVDGVRAVAEDLSRMRHIGNAPLQRISYSVAISANSAIDPVKRSPVPGYFDGMDSRPSNLHAAFRAASELLSDLAIMERCAHWATERGPRQLSSDLPWALRFLGDRARLTELAQDRTFPSGVRSSAVQELASLENIEPGIVVERFRELIREDSTESGPLWAAVGVLEKQDQIDSALLLIDQWLTAHREQDLTWAGVSSLKSRLLRKQGRVREAWSVAKTAAMTGKEGCLEEASLTLIDLGRLDEALEMAMSTRERYGDDSGAALVARILWMKGRDDEAAQVLTSPQKQLDASAWSSGVPAAFSEAFPKGKETRAGEAFAKLAVPSVPTLNILWFIEHLTANGRPDLALRLSERLKGRGPTGWMTVATYHAMLKTQGAPAAREWLRANSTPAEQDILAKQGLQEADYELVWALPDHPDATKNEILYLIRAACLLHQPEAQEDRRAQLIKFFESRPKKDFAVYGLFLLGQIDRPTLFAQITGLEYVSSVGWLIGLTSAHENRYEEANAWLQVCMETGANIPPRSWASVTLGRWNKEGRTLAEVAKKGIY